MSITVARTKKSLSAHAGLLTLKKLMKASRLEELVEKALPKLKSGQGRSYKKFCDLIMSLVSGADCIDDLAKLGEDQGFRALCHEKVYTPKAYGDFLRSFSPEELLGLQEALMRLAFLMREKLFSDDHQFFFDMDSTSNEQYGKKMEGVAMNYKGIECLDSLDVFDEKGLQYFIHVRPGATHTSLGAELVIHRLMVLFHEYKRKFQKKWRACFRADRGYYNVGFINACLAKGADVLVAVRQDEANFTQIINQVHNWKKTDLEDPERIKFFGNRECEIGTTNYRPTDCARRLRYIVIRSERPRAPLFPDDITYDYYAFATTYSELVMDNETVIKTYRRRGQAENYIKENKYGLDMKHYPCLKLNANRAFALISAFAYNFMRMMSLAHNPKKPSLSKKIRFQWINTPCLVARTGRNVVLKLMDVHYKEMMRWFELIHNLQFEYV